MGRCFTRFCTSKVFSDKTLLMLSSQHFWIKSERNNSGSILHFRKIWLLVSTIIQQLDIPAQYSYPWWYGVVKRDQGQNVNTKGTNFTHKKNLRQFSVPRKINIPFYLLGKFKLLQLLVDIRPQNFGFITILSQLNIVGSKKYLFSYQN